MKKVLICLLVSTIFAACNNDNNKATKDNYGAGNGDAAENMPGAIRTSFLNRYANGVVEKWKSETKNNQQVYEVKFKQGNEEKKAYFDAAGNFLQEEND